MHHGTHMCVCWQHGGMPEPGSCGLYCWRLDNPDFGCPDCMAMVDNPFCERGPEIAIEPPPAAAAAVESGPSVPSIAIEPPPAAVAVESGPSVLHAPLTACDVCGCTVSGAADNPDLLSQCMMCGLQGHSWAHRCLSPRCLYTICFHLYATCAQHNALVICQSCEFRAESGRTGCGGAMRYRQALCFRAYEQSGLPCRLPRRWVPGLAFLAQYPAHGPDEGIPAAAPMPCPPLDT